ncbi:MAG: DUF1501 domain-containing protein [Planctomycetota bacterium]|nr:DUF1501 domain-containing protein [Planctomycetota bacterium]MDA1212489.1 DUF1501 domain-containing protein [Planctomycetota bacterium]
MLQIADTSRRWNRRNVLQVGLGALGGTAFSGFNPLSGYAAPQTAIPVTGKSVVFLFMHGGPTQTETFDPKMTAPLGIRSATGEVSTTIPGVTLGGTYPLLAQRMHQLAVVRSFVPGDANHDIKTIVGRATHGANLGSLYSRVAGANHPINGLPTNALLFPRAVDPSTGPEINNFGRFDSTGSLGDGYKPFIPGAEGDAQNNLKLNLPLDRLGERRALLAHLDKLRRNLEGRIDPNSLDQLRERAFQTILGDVANIFDLSQEDPKTIARYDTEPLIAPYQIDKKWNNYQHYLDHVKSLGKLMLLARRLCEAGCGFITVTTSFVWDNHADSNNAGVEEGMRYCGRPFDHAVSAFLEDIESRGLSDKVMLVCCGEMGRTPRIDNKGGRNHWGNLGPLLIAGGGWEMGQVIGSSNRDVSGPAADAVTVPNLVSTILNTLLDVGTLRTLRDAHPDVLKAATAAEPIHQLG